MNTIKIKLPNEISTAINTLENNGYKAYLVGGSVRDYIMGNDVSDYDITTNATPENIHDIFDKCIDTGISHGTVTVIINHTHIEITTFRCDGKYSDHRRPDNVEFSLNIEDDLSRRDFTVNALAYNPKSGITDLFGGMKDIENKILKCVGNAETRFEEDALRMLRLIRFCSKLGFDAGKETLAALLKKENLIKYVSKERIREEIIKTFMSDYPQKVILFKDSKILDFVFECDFFEKTDDTILSNIKTLPSVHIVRMAYILYSLYSDDAEKSKNILSTLKFSNNEKHQITKIIGFVNYCIKNPDLFSDTYKVKKSMSNFGRDAICMAFDILSLYGDVCAFKEIFDSIERNNEPYLISHLDIDGKDLISIGIKGTLIGDCLDYLLDMVTINPSLNKKEFLIKEAECFYVKKSICKN